jgi:hypothetical protein
VSDGGRASQEPRGPVPPERRRLGLHALRPVLRFVLLACIIQACFAFLISLGDCLRYPGVDLRCRVTAARAYLAGLDPYTYEWVPGMPEDLLDPLKRHPGPGRFTNPPTLLALHVPFARLPYRSQRILWFLLEWSAMIASTALLAGVPRSRDGRFALLCVALAFFVGGTSWRFHAERGQFYVWNLLLLALAIAAAVRRGPGSAIPGLFVGLAVSIRPTLVVIPVLLFLLRQRRSALAAVGTAMAAIALTLPLVGWEGWRSYAANTRMWERIAEAGGYAEAGGGFDLGPLYGPARAVPAVAEGIAFEELPLETGGSTLVSILSSPPLDRLWPAGAAGSAALSKAGFIAFVFLMGMVAFRSARRTTPSTRFAYAFGIIAALDAEFFLPMRFSYADILYLAPLALLTPVLLHCERAQFAAVCCLSGLMIGGLRGLLGGHADLLQFGFLAGGLTLAVAQLSSGRLHRAGAIRPS